MTNGFYNPTGNPIGSSVALSAPVRGEFQLIGEGFDAIPDPPSPLIPGRALVVNPLGTGYSLTGGTFSIQGNFSVTGFDLNIGVPVGNLTMTWPSVAGTLATTTDATNIANAVVAAAGISVGTLGLLRAVTSTPPSITVLANSTPGDGGGGIFYWDSTDTTSADDNGCIINPNVGNAGRWKRILFDGKVSLNFYGVKGDGTTDDSAQIAAAFAFAHVNNLVITGAPKNYVNNSIINVDNRLRGIQLSGAQFTSTSATSHCFNFAPTASGGGTFANRAYYLPDVFNYTLGAAVHLYGAISAEIFIDQGNTCAQGVLIETDGTNNTTTRNRIRAGSLVNCTGSGVELRLAAGGGQEISYCRVEAATCQNNVNGLYINAGDAATTANVKGMYFDLGRCNGFGLANSRGVYCPTGTLSGPFYFASRHFGAFVTKDIDIPLGNGLTFDLGYTAAPAYGAINLVGSNNIIRTGLSDGGNMTSTATFIATATSGNSRGSFNSGTAIGANRIFVSCTANFTANTVAFFYLYSPLLTSHSTVAINCVPSGGSAFQPSYAASDNSLTNLCSQATHANEIIISVTTPQSGVQIFYFIIEVNA